jgi:hypothetical protein
MNNTSPKNFRHLAVTMDCDRHEKDRSKCFCGATIPLNTQYRVYLCLADGKPNHFNIFDHKHLEKGVAIGKSDYVIPKPETVTPIPVKLKNKSTKKAVATGKSSYTIPKPTKKGMIDKRGKRTTKS